MTNVSARQLPSYVTTRNFLKNIGTSRQGEIYLQIACNNSCVFCYTAHYPNREPSLQQIRFELMKAKEEGLEWINFTGGEPTLRADFLEILDYANRLGFATIYIKTHGRRFADLEFARKVVGKVSFVHISIHGPNAEVHDLVTRTPGSFDEAIGGIQNLVALGVPVVGMTVINRLNHRHLAATSRMLFDLGVCQNSFAFPYPSGYALDLFEEGVPLHEEARDDVRAALDVLAERGKHGTVDNIPLCYLKGYERYANHLWFSALGNDPHEHGPECGRCLYRPICNGIPGSYIRRRGWGEFAPVTEQIPPSWRDPRELTLPAGAVPVVTGRLLRQPHGGAVVGNTVIPLTPDGYRLLAAADGTVTLGEIRETLGPYPLAFVGSVLERRLLTLADSPTQPDRFPSIPPAPIAEGTLLEYPLHQQHPPYPVISLS